MVGFGQAVDINVWAHGLVTRNPQQYGKLHAEYARASRQNQLMNATVDAVAAALLCGQDKVGSTLGRGVVYEFRDLFCTYNSETGLLSADVTGWVRGCRVYGSLEPENRETVVLAVFRLCGTNMANIAWVTKTISSVVMKMKFVTNANFGKAIELLDQADPPPCLGRRRGRATVSEVKAEAPPPKKFSGSSIKDPFLFCLNAADYDARTGSYASRIKALLVCAVVVWVRKGAKGTTTSASVRAESSQGEFRQERRG